MPADDLALHAANGVLVDAIAQVEAIHVEAVGQFVNGLLERERALWMTGRAKGRCGAAVSEHVVFFDVERGPFVQIGRRARTARAGAAARGTEADELDGGDGAVFLGANP